MNGKDAHPKNCEAKCANNEDCVAFSMIGKKWCIGCDVKLTTKHQGAIAFKKDTGINSKYLYSKYLDIFQVLSWNLYDNDLNLSLSFQNEIPDCD